MALNSRSSDFGERSPVCADQQGQAVLEYILLLAVVVTVFSLVMGWFTQFGVAQKLTKPITVDFAKAYQFGDIHAEGFEQGSPKHHPRFIGGEGNFRIFINPKF